MPTGRTDVLDALRPLGMPVVRYPGGNFVSNHDWRHGIGPVAERPTRPMMAVNLGTGSAREAAALVEYCNLPVARPMPSCGWPTAMPSPMGWSCGASATRWTGRGGPVTCRGGPMPRRR